jgi:hypothetical protein
MGFLVGVPASCTRVGPDSSSDASLGASGFRGLSRLRPRGPQRDRGALTALRTRRSEAGHGGSGKRGEPGLTLFGEAAGKAGPRIVRPTSLSTGARGQGARGQSADRQRARTGHAGERGAAATPGRSAASPGARTRACRERNERGAEGASSEQSARDAEAELEGAVAANEGTPPGTLDPPAASAEAPHGVPPPRRAIRASCSRSLSTTEA